MLVQRIDSLNPLGSDLGHSESSSGQKFRNWAVLKNSLLNFLVINIVILEVTRMKEKESARLEPGAARSGSLTGFSDRKRFCRGFC